MRRNSRAIILYIYVYIAELCIGAINTYIHIYICILSDLYLYTHTHIAEHC